MNEAHARPRLIFLYGPPAVGKLTVARAIAERRRFRVLHNHVTFDAVAEVLPIGAPTFWEALDKVRLDLVTAAAREGIDLVYTFVFAPGDEPHVEDVVNAYESAGGAVMFVQLVAPPDELRRRVSDASRAVHNKIRDAASLDDVLREYDAYALIPGRDSVTIDLAATSPEEAASQIGEHIDALSQRDDGRSYEARPSGDGSVARIFAPFEPLASTSGSTKPPQAGRRLSGTSRVGGRAGRGSPSGRSTGARTSASRRR